MTHLIDIEIAQRCEMKPISEIANKLECEFYIYKGLGHALYEEAKDFNKRVLQFFEKCGTILLRHSLIILPAGILLVKMYAWSSYPAGSELCRNRTELRFSVRRLRLAHFFNKQLCKNANSEKVPIVC